MTRVTLLLLGVTLFSTPAEARWRHCSRGQILRVHMGRCVSIHSALASEIYVSRGRRGGLRKHAGELEGGKPDRELAASPPRCNPLTQCGDPIEDRVVDPPDGMTPRIDWAPRWPIGGYHIEWRL